MHKGMPLRSTKRTTTATMREVLSCCLLCYTKRLLAHSEMANNGSLALKVLDLPTLISVKDEGRSSEGQARASDSDSDARGTRKTRQIVHRRRRIDEPL